MKTKAQNRKGQVCCHTASSLTQQEELGVERALDLPFVPATSSANNASGYTCSHRKLFLSHIEVLVSCEPQAPSGLQRTAPHSSVPSASHFPVILRGWLGYGRGRQCLSFIQTCKLFHRHQSNLFILRPSSKSPWIPSPPRPILLYPPGWDVGALLLILTWDCHDAGKRSRWIPDPQRNRLLPAGCGTPQV
jgi:hypothetical protein